MAALLVVVVVAALILLLLVSAADFLLYDMVNNSLSEVIDSPVFESDPDVFVSDAALDARRDLLRGRKDGALGMMMLVLVLVVMVYVGEGFAAKY